MNLMASNLKKKPVLRFSLPGPDVPDVKVTPIPPLKPHPILPSGAIKTKDWFEVNQKVGLGAMRKFKKIGLTQKITLLMKKESTCQRPLNYIIIMTNIICYCQCL